MKIVMVMTLLLACLEGAPAELPEATVTPPPARARMVEAPGLRGYLVRPGEDEVVAAEVWAHATIEEAERLAARKAGERGHGVLLIGQDTQSERALRMAILPSQRTYLHQRTGFAACWMSSVVG